MCAAFNGCPCTTVVFSSSSTNTTYVTNLSTFYNELSSIVRYIPKYNVVIVNGDMNTKIGKDGNNKFCLRHSPPEMVNN